MTKSDEFRFQISDQGRLPICGICIDGILPTPYSSWSDNGRFWAFDEKPSDEIIARFKVYLANPGCTDKQHAWFEALKLRDAHEDVERALFRFYQEAQKPTGWSIADDQ